jgi:hypothetical protein
MERPPRTLPPEVERRVVALCDGHLTREQTLLADLLRSLRQVRTAFLQRTLSVLPALQLQQKQLVQEATEMAAVRDRFRTALADLLGVSEQEVTLRAVALSLSPPARDRLLQRRDHLAAMVREADQLCQHNAALLGYARGFFACLFAGLTGASPNECYGRQGERQSPLVPTRTGTLLEARV